MADFIWGDKVTVYDDDLVVKTRKAVVLGYAGKDKKGYPTYRIEFSDGARSIVREEWLKLQLPPMMPDAATYLEALNSLQN
jgi:hypothetical protein